MGAVVTIVLIAVVAHLWRKLGSLQERVHELEIRGASFHEPAVAPTVVEPEEPAFAEPEPLPLPQRAVAEWLHGDFEKAEAVEPEPLEEPEIAEDIADDAEEPKRGFGFEDLFGRRLPIWAGGVTLAVAGMLIVKYSIDAGLISPLVRVISGLIFGVTLIGGAELALRAEEKVRDPRVRQALSGAGIASLYGAVLIASNLYDLIGPGTAFIGMAAITALAMGLSLRFGAPSALLGLAGGLAAPALVGSGEPNIPLLASYLALAVGGLTVLSKSQRWMWLGIAALTGGFGWAGVLLLSGTLDTAASLSLGLYIILLGVILPTIAFSGSLANVVRIAGSIAAASQIAGLVATGGFSLLHWGLFGLISAAILWLSSRDEALRRLPAVGLAIMLLLLNVWPNPTPERLGLVMGVGAALYAIPALIALWRPKGSMLEAAELAAIALGGLIIPMVHFYRVDGSNDVALALAGLGSALLPAVAIAIGWNSTHRADDHRQVLLVTTSAALIAASSALALPDWALAPVVGLLALGILAISVRSDDRATEVSAWSFGGLALALLFAGSEVTQELARIAGAADKVTIGLALLRWGGMATIFGIFAWQALGRVGREIAQALAALLAYAALAQLPLGDALPLVPAAALAAIAYADRALGWNRLLPAMAALLATSLLWAVGPAAQWSSSAIMSLFGFPILATAMPTVQATLLKLLAPGIFITLGWSFADEDLHRLTRRVAPAAAAMIGAIALHILFTHLWSIDSMSEFARLGLAQRISLEVLLLGGALLAWRFGKLVPALILTCASLGHFGWYTMVLHNPLFAEQAVGPTPIANLLLPAYGLPLLWLWLLKQKHPELPGIVERIRSTAPMLLILLFAFSSLRQVFHGSILAHGSVSSGEDILRSILAILLAIGFLLWGIHRSSRDWRIASLAIMILAVAKVFLLDASGLEGLLRIASFVALGFSLIGIGWLYSRFLNEDRELLPKLGRAAA